MKIYLKVISIQYFEAFVEDFLVHLSLVNVELYDFEEFDRCFEAYLKFLCALHCLSCRSLEHSCFDLDLLNVFHHLCWFFLTQSRNSASGGAEDSLDVVLVNRSS